MRVYTSGVFDLLHYGHMNILKKSKELSDNVFLIVGVHSDEEVEKYKRKPIMTMKERIEVLEHCKYIDMIIPDAPLKTTKEFCERYNIDAVVGIVCRCGNIDHDSQYDEIADIFHEVEYTNTISTTELIRRCQGNK